MMHRTSLLTRFLRWYLIFAFGNSLFKILSQVYEFYRARTLWKNLKGRNSDALARRFRTFGKDMHDYFAEPALEFPSEDIVKIDTMSPGIMALSPRAVKWLLKDDFQVITKPGPKLELWNMMRTFLGGNGIFVLRHGDQHKEEHKMWHKQRKVSSLIFTKNNFMTTFYDTFVQKSKLLIKKLHTEDGNVVDLQSLFFCFTMDSIEKFFMGVDIDTINGGQSEYAKHFDDAHSCMLDFVTSNFLVMILARRFLPFPFGTLGFKETVHTSLLFKLKTLFSRPYKEFHSHVKKLEDHVYKYVKETRQDKNIKNRKDIIANFINSDIGNDLDDKILRDIVLNLTLAGRDTTACALSWMFFELTQNEEVQQKLIEEIDGVLKGAVPTLSDLEASNMPYLNGVVYETLRLHPPVPTNSKMVEKTTKFLDGTVIPAGTSVFYSPRGIGRNSSVYRDPLKFIPTRWIPFQQPGQYEFPVFQAGPRFCLGKDMAQFEMKLVTVMLLQNFKFTLKEGEAGKIKYSLMLTQSIATDKSRQEMKLLCIPHAR